MFKFVIQKILSKKWMILSLLIGNILLISIVCATPIYSDAVLQRTLMKNLNNYIVEENSYPGNMDISFTYSKSKPLTEEFLSFYDNSLNDVTYALNLPIINNITENFIDSDTIQVPNSDNSDKMESTQLRLGFITDFESHSQLVSGEMYSNEFEPDGSIGVVVSESTLIKKNLFVGETYFFNRLQDENGNPYAITIKGVFTNSDDSDIYWINSPTSYAQHAFMDETLFKEYFANIENHSNSVLMRNTVQVDYSAMKSSDTELMVETIENFDKQAEDFEYFQASIDFDEIIFDHHTEMTRLNITLLVLQVPIYVLLAVFIFMVSRQMIEAELSEIAVFKSRGASKNQILNIYLIQSIIISGSSLLIGLPIGYLLCQVLGSSNAFLEFVGRSALPASFNTQSIVYSLIAALFSVITMVFPAFKHANVGIVVAKRNKQQKFRAKWWEKIGLDIVLLSLSLYGWYSFNAQQELIAQRVENGEGLDPVMFLNSSVFIIGAGLLSLRIFPWFMKLLFIIRKKKHSPATYVSFKQVIETKDNQGFLMLFLIMTISLGIFNSISARTINSNEEERIKYENGADIVLKEFWDSTEAQDGEETFFLEPDFDRFSFIEDVDSYTKVYINDNIDVSTDNGDFSNTTVMGIHTKEFGETAYFKDDLLSRHWYDYLNAISQNPEAILLSSNARDEFSLEVGDNIIYKENGNKSTVRGVIYGFIDYWPTYNDTSYTVGIDGVKTESNHYFIVGHLSYIQSVYTNRPYEVWFNMTDSSEPMYDFIDEYNPDLTKFEDTNIEITEQKNDPIFQGTNGLLTVGFIMILSLCAVGFLIYWTMSISARQLQFGIFRAMGMSMKEILYMLVFEQICVSGYAILVGGIVGFISSYLFVPLIEINYAAVEQSIPLEIISSTADNIRIFVVIAIMITICLSVLSAMVSKLKIAQALKLGED